MVNECFCDVPKIKDVKISQLFNGIGAYLTRCTIITPYIKSKGCHRRRIPVPVLCMAEVHWWYVITRVEHGTMQISAQHRTLEATLFVASVIGNMLI